MSFEVRVPASSANLGPGFDSLAVALSIYLTVTVDPDAPPSRTKTELDLFGGDDLVEIGIRRASNYLGVQVPRCEMQMDAQIPVARGLGSSAAAIVAGLQIGAKLATGRELSHEELIQIGGSVEGHADNIASAVLGGVTAAIDAGSRFIAARVANELPWQPVLFVPDSAAFTQVARGVLPKRVPLADAGANVGRTALLVKAIRDGDNELVRLAMDDRLHQPYRARLFPHLSAVIDAGYDAGAVGGCLSGAGPSVLLLVPSEHAAEVASAVDSVVATLSVPGRVMTPQLDHDGVRIHRKR